ncbi:MAG: DNA repair protein RecN [Thermodesulfobacteriota bacterium]
MLQELHIRDFAIIDDLRITFDQGLNILTGETGAGKSIIIDAVNVLLGDKVAQDIIRADREEALVEGLFDISGRPEVKDMLDESGIDADNDTLLIKRVIPRKGKGRVYINGGFATLSMLVSIGGRLIDIYGQHDHQSLVKPGSHLNIIDAYGGLLSLRKEVRDRYGRLVSTRRELDGLSSISEERLKRREDISYQLQEINNLHLEAGEEERLKKERERLKFSERIAEVIGNGFDTIYSREGSVMELLNKVAEGLKEVSQIDETLKKYLEPLETVLFQLEDIAMDLRNYNKETGANPRHIDEIEERLTLLAQLKRKYGKGIEELLRLTGEMEEELKGISDGDERGIELKKEVDCLKDKLLNLSNELSQKRREAAKRLKKGVEKELSQLGMEKALFEVRIENRPMGEKGIDAVEFYISTNLGEEAKPLSKIASGGELSRIMLALKLVAKTRGVPTLIFDEIDAGIGGKVAEGIGIRLKRLSIDNQVLCITHLPQIACCGMIHYHVFKEEEDGRTAVRVKRLDREEKVEEISRMLGGIRITQKTREHAEEMLGNTLNGELYG